MDATRTIEYVAGHDMTFNTRASLLTTLGTDETQSGSSSVMRVMVGATARLMESHDAGGEVWISTLCDEVRTVCTRLVEGAGRARVGVCAQVVVAAPGAVRWHATLVGASGYADPATLHAVIEHARADSPQDDLPCGHGPTGGLPLPGVRSRRELIPDEFWGATALAQHRARLGLGEFVRSVTHLTRYEPNTALVLQVDAARGATLDIARIGELMEIMAPALEEAFVSSVGRSERHRRQIMQRVSPAQRPIVELLVTGLTEREIGAKIHRSPHTVHDHIKSIYAALGVSNRFDLLRLWMNRSGQGVVR